MLRSLFRLCYLMDNPLTSPEELLDAGVTSLFLKFSDRTLSESELKSVQHAAEIFLSKSRYVFVMDDSVLALQLDASGVFYSNQLPARCRELMGPSKFIGIQIRNEKAMESAQNNPDIDFYGIGPVLQFGAKATTPLGTEFATQTSKELRSKPVFWMGGIQLHEVATFDPGFADGVCVMRSLDVPNRHSEAQNFHQLLAKKLGPSIWSAGKQPEDVTFRPKVKNQSE